MKHIKDDRLRRFVAAVFAKAGSSTHEADMIAKRLVDSNLMGHDSHGVVRVTSYIGWLGEGKIKPNMHVKVVAEADAPLITVEAVVQGVKVRANEAVEPERMAGDDVRGRLADIRCRTTP